MKNALLEMHARWLCKWHTEKGRDHWDAEPELKAKANTLYGLRARGLIEYERGFLYPADARYGTYFNKWRLTEAGIDAAINLVK